MKIEWNPHSIADLLGTSSHAFEVCFASSISWGHDQWKFLHERLSLDSSNASKKWLELLHTSSSEIPMASITCITDEPLIPQLWVAPIFQDLSFKWQSSLWEYRANFVECCGMYGSFSFLFPLWNLMDAGDLTWKEVASARKYVPLVKSSSQTLSHHCLWQCLT